MVPLDSWGKVPPCNRLDRHFDRQLSEFLKERPEVVREKTLFSPGVCLGVALGEHRFCSSPGVISWSAISTWSSSAAGRARGTQAEAQRSSY